jgi:Fur family peroxide stress response transcriptional regulator
LTSVAILDRIKLGIILNLFAGEDMRKYSKQREIVLDILKKSYNHPTAEEIFAEARILDNNISLGTVYRNLDILCEDQVIEKIPTPTGKDRYDFKKTEHSHAICEKCGKITDFPHPINIKKLQKDIKDQVNFELSQDEIRIIGICENCKNSN